MRAVEIENNVIKRYNHNSTNNYPTLCDLERLFIDLYGLQNQISTFLFNELELEQVH
jgi:hypothetical protein